ncbi:DUF6415 family natural product biosynthesis protein [Streptomyces mobaraensis]|uniref:DUF6415 family natural product biosynthesis protein n=1 Tax=Streptomyces mobaraensis TaxID=35621 RepID=UPI0033E8D755
MTRQDLIDVIGRALMPTAVLPRAEEVRELTERLRDHVTRLAREVEDRTGAMTPSTDERRHATSAVEDARRELGAGPGPGLRSAVAHMQNLARVCQRLRCHSSSGAAWSAEPRRTSPRARNGQDQAPPVSGSGTCRNGM